MFISFSLDMLMFINVFIWVILIDVFVQGGMSTIFFDSKAIKIFVVMNGAGQLEMACLHLAQEHGQGQQGCSGFQEGQGQQGHRGSQEQEQEKKSPTGEDYQSDGSDED